MQAEPLRQPMFVSMHGAASASACVCLCVCVCVCVRASVCVIMCECVLALRMCATYEKCAHMYQTNHFTFHMSHVTIQQP